MIWLFLLLSLAGCKSVDLQPPLPSPQVVEVGITPSLNPIFHERLAACEHKTHGIAILVKVQPSTALNVHQSDIIFQIGDMGLEEDVFPFQVGLAEIILIAHPSLATESLNLDLIQGYYTIPQTPIQTWTYPANHELRFYFDSVFMASGEISPTTSIAPGLSEMNEAISRNPNAIGYTLKSWLTKDVQEIYINTSIRDSLRHPILAVTSKYPQGIVKEFLACLQTIGP